MRNASHTCKDYRRRRREEEEEEEVEVEVQEANAHEKKIMGKSMSKWSEWFGRKKNIVNDVSENRVLEVPGSLGVTVFNVLGLVTSGHNFYRSKRDDNNSNIFKVCIYKPRIVLCSYEAIRHIYESPDVRKEPSFGMFVFNYKILGDHTPLIFENDETHHKRRAIFIELVKTLVCNEQFVENVDRDIEIELQELSKKIADDPSQDFEDLIAQAVCNVISQNIVGKRIDHELMKGWMENCLIKKFKKGRPEAAGIYEKLRDSIQASEKYRELTAKILGGSDVTGEEICNEIIFALV